MVEPADSRELLSKIDGGVVTVTDLLKRLKKDLDTNDVAGRARNVFRLAVDIEDCLDRWYGGYYSDWVCGGQWNRANQFVQLLADAFKKKNIEIIVFFDGTLGKTRTSKTYNADFRHKKVTVLKHIRTVGTPPPKVWWLPPTGIRTALRNSLRSAQVQVVQTVKNHTKEIIDYFREHKLNAILGQHPNYLIANVTPFFSCHDLRLSYRGELETTEFVVAKLLQTLNLTAEQLPLLGILCGLSHFIDNSKLKEIHKTLDINSNASCETRLQRIAEVIRQCPKDCEISEAIKSLDLGKFEREIKDSLVYFQGFTKPMSKSGVNKLRTDLLRSIKATDIPSIPDANNIRRELQANNGGFRSTYTLPVEVIKTALNRHQRGMMDPRIYQLVKKKEIFLPQLLEDDQGREVPNIHLFYRPARQHIYAILFNLYHQKFLYVKQTSGGESGQRKQERKRNEKKSDNEKPSHETAAQPKVLIAEWMWSPKDEHQHKPELVEAVTLQWAVPTIQRLWFGNSTDDRQTRMRAFLTIMRSDSTLMLNRIYVPQHLIVLACVLRYIITNSDKRILTRSELDAFLATAFSPQLAMVENTQKLVLPGLCQRGVFLATLFMQGVETASLANDACGVPLPWFMANPWLFFDGKIFHLKLKMASYVDNLQDLCDNQIDIVLKVERLRQAILEDVEHMIMPLSLMDLTHRSGLFSNQTQMLQSLRNNLALAMGQQCDNNMLLEMSNELLLQSPHYGMQSLLMNPDNALDMLNLGGALQNSNVNQMRRSGKGGMQWPNSSNNGGFGNMPLLGRNNNMPFSGGAGAAAYNSRLGARKRGMGGNAILGYMAAHHSMLSGRHHNYNRNRNFLNVSHHKGAVGGRSNRRNNMSRNRKRKTLRRGNKKTKSKKSADATSKTASENENENDNDNDDDNDNDNDNENGNETESDDKANENTTEEEDVQENQKSDSVNTDATELATAMCSLILPEAQQNGEQPNQTQTIPVEIASKE